MRNLPDVTVLTTQEYAVLKTAESNHWPVTERMPIQLCTKSSMLDTARKGGALNKDDML